MSKTLLLAFVYFFLQTCSAQKEYARIVDYYHAEKNFNGVVLVADNGKVEFLAGIGTANRQNPSAIYPDTKFKVASITKTFTAVLALQLFEKGQLDLKVPIGKYLPDYKGAAKNKATIHHLLTYSSGIPNCEGNTGIAVYQSPMSVDEFIQRFCSGNPEFEPGAQFNYNNGDYIILGRIIERITGKSFAQNVQDNILQPLKMENTGLFYHKNIVGGLAETYNLDDSTGTFYRDDPMYLENYYSAGAMYATAEDLLKFDQGIFGYKLLSKKTVELMLTPYPELYGVAYGFWVTDNQYGTKTFKAANRQGSIWGANANWLHLMDNNSTFIILSNTNATNLPEMTEQLVLTSSEQAIAASIAKYAPTSKFDLNAVKGTWQLDLRPEPTGDAYLMEFQIEPTKGRSFNGVFYGTPFSGGYFNTDWEHLYFAFSTADKDNTYYHSGYIAGNDIYGMSYCEGRNFTAH